MPTEIIKSGPSVTAEELDLIRKTVANGATDTELKLYLYDCQRQGVHPLDKLLHFTKRGGKYTPVTSIDLMRMRAADTGEYGGSDDALFGNQAQSYPESASVTVWRLVQSQRCAFTATARWDEYCPPTGSDHMWRKMPYTMLGKCAEALALRKGFPRQLAGLYATEELDQAAQGYAAIPAPVVPLAAIPPPTGETHHAPVEEASSVPNEGALRDTSLPEGVVRILKVEAGWKNGKAKGFVRHSGQLPGEDHLAVYLDPLVALASQYCQDQAPVRLETKQSGASGKWYVTAIHRIKADGPPPIMEEPPPLTDEDIPF